MSTAVATDIGAWLAKAKLENWTGQHDLPIGRDDLAAFWGATGCFKGAEIGVERGFFSEALCKANPRLELLCVDAWRAYPGYREHVTQQKLTEILESFVQRMEAYRYRSIRSFSVDAARQIDDASLDFVYIDGNHTFPHVVADVAAWAPKVRSGGIVAGHDYGRSSVGHVKEAVDAWVSAYKIAPLFILRGDRSPSWLYVQP